MKRCIHRVACAAAVNGCDSFLVWEDYDPSKEHYNERLLELNGWKLHAGRWLCGKDHIKKI